jgi:hypothetical protein
VGERDRVLAYTNTNNNGVASSNAVIFNIFIA